MIKKYTFFNKKKKYINNILPNNPSPQLFAPAPTPVLKDSIMPPIREEYNEIQHLLEDRLAICLPLDFIHINSPYGERKDPIHRTINFHDGIDLKCQYQYVYSMLKGVVKDIKYSNKGYGNYIIMQYGELECLYGHLDKIFININDTLPAGSIVAISGNTGKSTGPHLHIRLRLKGKSINPIEFINFLANHIESLDKELSNIFPTPSSKELNKKNLYIEIIKNNLLYPNIILAQALLETGYFTSNVCKIHHNLFGLRKPSTGEYYHFQKWEDSVIAYKKYVQYKYKGGNYLDFLNRIGYAEDSKYTDKLQKLMDKF